MFNHLKVIVLSNIQTNKDIQLKTNINLTPLCYAGRESNKSDHRSPRKLLWTDKGLFFTDTCFPVAQLTM